MASASPLRRHTEFYKPDGNLVIQVTVNYAHLTSSIIFDASSTLIIQVELTLYRVHKSTIKCSIIFASTLSVPQPEEPGAAREGSCDEHPFIISLETCTDFEALLAWFYPRSYHEMKALYSNRDSLISLLKMASRYDVEDALALAQD
ncbi:hypothetical protein BOTBODRAFT_180527 [Botryobasidium botryosum FD-172 SS1]|uniref:BTB domain-containing protein n=1 Tax=Botryobasidium botryosum (strain FD-172 SS1) TaxID=930990 RepID=A0A067LWA6_BOTB1|nr:hypothetical protein BOTBODRAFT_180527 [Botryobasidium botryosum FD-172 SS1]